MARRLAVLIGVALGILFGVPGLASRPAGAATNPPVVLSAETESATLAGHLDLLVDPDGVLTIDDARARDADFRPLPGFLGAGHTLDVHWYRFDVTRHAGTPPTWALAMGAPYLDHIDVFVPAEGGGWRTLRTGDQIPYSRRPVRTRQLAVPLPLPADTPTTVYVRVASISAMTFTATLWRPEAFMADATDSLLMHGMFLGLLALVIVLYAFLGAMLADSALIGYTLYVATLFVYYLFANGIAAVLLPDMAGWLLNLLTGGSGLVGVAAALFMWDRLLNLRANYPRVHRLYMAVSLLALASAPAAVMPVYGLVNRLVVGAGMLMTLASLVLLVLMMRRQRADVSLRYYFAAFLIAFSGLVVAQLALRGVLPVTGLTANSYQIASAIQVIVLGLGLSHRVRRLQADIVRAEQETRVALARAEEQRTFLAMLSHEFRTPLASIDSAAQLIEARERTLGEASLERVTRIRTVARRLCDLVDLFLSSEALDHGALALKTEPVALRPFLDGVLAQILADAPPAPIRLSVAPDDGPVSIDPQFMGIAVTNLVHNALRYSPDGAPVEVTARTGPEGGTITVSDQGHGMTADEVARIGTMYFRATSAQGTKGVGIGLYITRKIVAAHGGTLEVSSAVGAGTRFVIRLPAA